jgi:hypothetical protein
MDARLVTKVMIQNVVARGQNGDINGDGTFKISMLAVDDAFGKPTVSDLKMWAQTLHPTPPPLIEEIFVSAQLNTMTYDWSADLMKLSDQFNQTTSQNDGPPDIVLPVLLAGLYPSFIREAKATGFAVPMLNPHSARSDVVIKALGNLADGMEGISQLNFYGSPYQQSYIDAYHKQFGSTAAPGNPRSYDAGFLAGLALVDATRDLRDPRQVTGEQMRQALLNVEHPSGEKIGPGAAEFARAVSLLVAGKTINYDGLSGPLDFDENLNVRQDLVHYTAQGGKWIEGARYQCVLSDECPKKE